MENVSKIHGGVCVVPGCGYCKRNGGKKQLCHKIPMKESIRKKWLDNIGCESLKKVSDKEIKSKELFVCPKHFLPTAYSIKTQNGASRLKNDAIPTENLLLEQSSTSGINLPSRANQESFTNSNSTIDCHLNASVEEPMEIENFSSNLLIGANQTAPTEPMDISTEAPQSSNQEEQNKEGEKNVSNSVDEIPGRSTIPQLLNVHVRPNKRCSWRVPASSSREKQLLL